MSVIVFAIGGLLGALAASVHMVFFSASFSQGVLTYFATSLSACGAIAITAWVSSRYMQRTRRTRPSLEQQLEDWQDWKFEEDAEAIMRESSGEADVIEEDRKSA